MKTQPNGDPQPPPPRRPAIERTFVTTAPRGTLTPQSDIRPATQLDMMLAAEAARWAGRLLPLPDWAAAAVRRRLDQGQTAETQAVKEGL